ncbi:MAG: transporter [Lysobacteraceae bacterium]
MNRFFRPLALAPLALAPLLFAAPAARACSSCGCTLSTGWDSQGFATTAGFRVDLRHDFLNQSQLRSGTDALDRGDYPLPQDFELEKGTLNRYTTLGIDYSSGGDWGVNVALPYVDRDHATYPEGETALAKSHSSSFGDARVLVRWQGFTPEHNVGLQFGLKLPTGSHDVRFASGPEAGEPLDRGLQPGTGTTDLLLGAYRFGPMNQDWDWFVQGLAEVALGSRDGFRPGPALNLNAGVRYVANARVVPELQLNGRVSRRDTGMDADTDNSGGTLLDLSPGVTVKVTDKLHLFGYVQVPLYQRVNGIQLAPRYTTSIGARYDF